LQNNLKGIKLKNMALTKCPDCGKEISDSAPQCPYCGSLDTAVSNQNKEVRKFVRGAGIFAGTFYLIFISILMLLSILIFAIFNGKVALFFTFILFVFWWFWLTAIRKTKIK